MNYVLGIDIGTSGTKAVLYDMSGSKVDEASQSYAMYTPKSGYAEQDANDWYNATIKCIKEITAKMPHTAHDIKGIGLSGQMHGLVMLDNKCSTLYNSIIWCDTRTDKESDFINESMANYKDYNINSSIPAFTLPKLIWVKNHLPDIYRKINKVLLPKDYVNYKLTGNFTTDVSDASGTGMLDVAKRQWSKEIIKHLDININWLANVHESADVVGNITKHIADITGLSEETIVVAGAGDQAAAALGNSVIINGDASMSVGSSGVVFAALSSPLCDKKGRVQTFCHALENTWHIMGVTQSACLSLSWFKSNFASGISYQQLDKMAKEVPLGCEGIVFLPYIQGERTPHLDSDIRGGFIGLDISHKLQHLYRAVLEGVALSMRDCIEVMEDVGVKINDMVVSGGGASSQVWLDIIANITKCKLICKEVSESGTRGVAVLAAVGAKFFKSVKIADKEFINNIKNSTIPELDSSNLVEALYAKYKSLYPLLSNI